MSNDNYPARTDRTIEDDYLTADETVVGNPYVGPQQGNTQLDPYGSPCQQDVPTVSPGSTAPQRRIVQDAPTVQMNRPRVAQQGHLADNRAHGHAQRAYDWPPATSAYGSNSYDPSPVDSGASGRQSPQQAAAQRFRCGASALRLIVRLLCLGLLVFGAMTIYYLTEQPLADTSALSSSAGSFAEYGAYLVQSGQLPTFEENPIKWTAAHILLLSVKFSNHGLSVRQQAHVVEFALMGGVIALNVLAWMSGWAHRRSSRGHIRIWRTWFMFALSAVSCAAVSFADQYHKLYVPGRHFDKLDLFLDASGYISAITCVFIAWSIGSAVYRLVLRK